MSNFRQCDRETPYLLPPSVDEWLPADHLARFVVDIVEQLDLAPLARQYRGAGSAAYHPSVLLGLLIYGYATGTFGSRRIEQCDLRVAGVSLHRRQHPSRPRHLMYLSQALPAGD